ncbi:hypothetical protein Peur_007001 [Populus x canadensis]
MEDLKWPGVLGSLVMGEQNQGPRGWQRRFKKNERGWAAVWSRGRCAGKKNLSGRRLRVCARRLPEEENQNGGGPVWFLFFCQGRGQPLVLFGSGFSMAAWVRSRKC